MGNMPPEVALVILLVSMGYFLAGSIVDGVKHVGHKTKCGVMLIVGKHCEPPQTDPDQAAPKP
jgi:hypothetical protein